MKFIIFIIFPIFWNVECLAKPMEQTVTETNVEVTPYPDAQKRYVDINNVSPEVSSILRENNLNLDQIKTLHAKLQSRTANQDKDFYHVIPSSTNPTPTAAKEYDEEMRLNNIRKSLVKTLRDTSENDQHQSNAEFDYTLAAICEIPRHINLSEWFGQKTWNIFFKPNYRQYNVKSVFLRLFKVSKSGTKTTSRECNPDVGDFYKLTVSVYTRKRKEIKKKIIYAQMIQSNFNGWVEIDALSTLKFWDLPKNNYGLAIDIFDQDDNQLDAKEHFHLQNCEAGPQIPWRAFKLIAESVRTPVSEDDVEIYRNLYTGPRLDITSTNPAKYHISSNEDQQQDQKSTRHLRHTHHHYHLQRSSEESMESFERKSHKATAERRDHSHRSNKKVGET